MSGLCPFPLSKDGPEGVWGGLGRTRQKVGVVPVRRLLISVLGLLLVFSVPGAGLGAAPVFSSGNIEVVGAAPSAAIISSVFSSTSPHLYASTLRGVEVYDVSEPTRPALTGFVPLPHFENEGVTLGERATGEKFVIVGFDLIGATPTYSQPRPGTYDEIAVVEVTDPSAPTVVARMKFSRPGSAHTVQCANTECTHAYSAGYSQNRQGEPSDFFTVIDLTDFRNPVDAGIRPSTVGEVGHDWDIDEAGVAWHVGWEGTAAYDISDPANPVLLNSTDANGLNGSSPWNDFIHHNSARPNADRFGPANTPRGKSAAANKQPSIDNGNVLLVTEEDYDDPTCAGEGSFQTWHVPTLAPGTNPTGEAGGGTITPLDYWNTELADSGIKTPAGAFCSAHYFDVHDTGLVAQGWYQQGVRLLDVRDPRDIKQVGYYITGAQETWSAEWVPEYGEDGRQTGRDTNLLYTNDPSRGLEVLKVQLPETAPEATAAVTAPILSEWLLPNPAAAAAAKASFFGAACRIPSLT